MADELPAHIGSYHILGLIGGGRLGTVYRAYQETQARVVALRVWSADMVDNAPAMERIRRDGQTLAAIKHRNIACTLDAGRDGDLHFTVSEYLDGGALTDRLRGARPTVAEAVQVTREVAAGLGAAHAQGIVHGDLTPRSVLVSRDLSQIKVTDFAMAAPPDTAPGAQTITGAHLGLMFYRAPELLTGQGMADARSDIYSLGVIAYEALTGKMPIGKFGLPSDANRQVPFALDPIVLKCLAADPGQRYQSVAALVADVDKLRDVRDYQVISELKQLSGGRLFKGPRKKSLARGGSRRSAYLGLAAIVAVVGGVVAVPMLRRAPGPSPVTATPPPSTAPTAGAASPSEPTPTPAPMPASTPMAAPMSASPTPPVASAPPVEVTPAAAPGKASAAAASAKRAVPDRTRAPVDPNAAAGALYNDAQALIAAKNTTEARLRLATIGTSYSKSSWFVPAMSAKIALEDKARLREVDSVTGLSVPASLITRRLLVELAPGHPSAEATLWWLAEAYDDLKQYPLAAQAYAQLGTNFPGTKYDAWFKAAETFERRLSNKDEARTAYLKVPATSSRYNEAQKRSRALAAR